MNSINENAPVKIRQIIQVKATPEKVWSVLTNIDGWPGWNPDIPNAKLNGQLIPGTTFDWKSGGTKIHSKLHTVQPFEKFGWTGKAMGSLAIHNWTLTKNGNETEVLVEESMDGFLVKLLKGMMQKTLDKSSASWLQHLKTESEK